MSVKVKRWPHRFQISCLASHLTQPLYLLLKLLEVKVREKLNEYKICFLVNRFLLSECRHMAALSVALQGRGYITQYLHHDCVSTSLG